MDQRRFISFLMLSVAVMLLFSVLFPPPPPPDQPAAPAAAQEDGEADAPENVDQAEAEGQLTEQPAGLPALNQPPQVAAADVPTQFFTLGSLDPESGYRILATFSNSGASLRRAEMTSPRYRDQHDRSGYLGELELVPADGGIKVQAVGAGTPAAAAGIVVGDVIVGIGQPQSTEIRNVDDFTTALAGTEPGQQITLQVRRGDGEPQSITVKQLIWRPFAVVRPEIENYRMRNAEPPPNFDDPASLLVSLYSLNGTLLDDANAKRLADLLRTGNWEVADSSATSITFRVGLPDLGLELIKRFTLEPAPASARAISEHPDYPGYHLQLDIELRNTADATKTVGYRLDGPTGMPIEGWWFAHKISRSRWFGAAGLRDIVVRFDGHQVTQFDAPQIAEGDVEPMGDGEALSYAGVDGQYFSAVLIPIRKELNEVWFDTVEAIVAGTPLDPRTPPTYTNTTCRLSRQSLELSAGAVHRDSYQVFLGPKRPELLVQYHAAGDLNHTLKDIIYYGLALFAAVARAMLAILHFFYSIVGNYGIAIVLLTVLVRGAMFPISFKQTQNMAQMQALKPEMDRITEKYKTDMQKRSQAIQELYRKHSINPLGGCLPVFLQLPIFIGLYRALMVDVELRLSPLFGQAIRWCSNLAAPDMFLDWSSLMPDFVNNGQGIFGLGPYLNVLPIVTVALFLVTQKMAMPEPTNEQAVLQQKMMKYMTGFMGLLFYKVASGLCLYFIASSLWGIAERKLLPKAQAPPTASAGGTTGSIPGSGGKPSGNGGSKPPTNGSPRTSRPPKAKRKSKLLPLHRSDQIGPAIAGHPGWLRDRDHPPAMTYDPDETICAIASAAGGAARGMIRVSGPQALAVVAPLFRTEAGVPVEWPTRAMAIVGNLRVPLTEDRPGANRLQSTSDKRNESIVPCELFVWPNQRSYTREPVVEVHTFGSAPILDAVLAAVCRTGARLAEPGEFTLRAFLAGRIDLAQAEAVLGVIDASRSDELDNALAQLAGGLSYPLRTMRHDLLQLLAELEAGLDFVEEDIQFVSRREVLTRLKGAEELLARIDRQMVSRQISPTTCQIALLGPPNAGKSSLFNALTRRFEIRGEEKNPFAAEALVSPARGTTRDYLIAAINVDGVRCELLDTAGVDTCEAGRVEMSTSLRQTGDTAGIEETAAALATEHGHRATIRVLCVEASRFFEHACDASAAALGQICDVFVLTKADLLPQSIEIAHMGQSVPTVLTSSHTGMGLDELAKLIGGVLASANRTQRGHAVASTAERCRESIRCAGQALASALELAEHDRGAELIAAEIRVSLDELGKVVGATYTEDLLDRIFSTFCIGK